MKLILIFKLSPDLSSDIKNIVKVQMPLFAARGSYYNKGNFGIITRRDGA